MQHEDMVLILVQAIAHHKAGRLADAEPLYRQVLDYSPNTATALQNLGLILSKSGKSDEVIQYSADRWNLSRRFRCSIATSGRSIGVWTAPRKRSTPSAKPAS